MVSMSGLNCLLRMIILVTLFAAADYATAQVQPAVVSTTSSTITIEWPAIELATGYNIYLASEPANLSAASQRKIITTFGSNIRKYTVRNLTANSDIFLRVVGQGTSIYFDYYAKTVGGQGVKLDPIIVSGMANTAVQSVHLYAPNILLLVIKDHRAESFSLSGDSLDKGVNALQKYTGASWQSGSWSIKRNNGANLAVTEVYRDSLPVGNLYDEVKENGEVPGRFLDHLMDVEHNIYLKLSAAVGSNDILEIAGPNNLKLLLPYSDHYLETPVIQLNQVGFNPRAKKRYAYVSGWMGDGGALSLDNFPTKAKVLQESTSPLDPRGVILSSLAIALRSSNDIASGGAVKEINLANLPENDLAYYRVHIPGVGVSYRTMVSEKATLKAHYVLSRGLFLNRWGRDLNCSYTDWCARKPDHPNVYTAEKKEQGFFPADTPKVGSRPLAGGHHDAGDYDIRIYHTIVARQMLRAFELNEHAFSDNQLNIPESGNKIPDFLDEILWSLNGWAQLQEADGGARPGVESYRHPLGNQFADADQLPYWTYARDPIHSLRVAGLFAQASRLVAPYNKAKSDELRLRAISAYNYAVQSGATKEIGGPFVHAVSELYRLTGESQYKSAFEQAWDYADKFKKGMPSIRHNEYWTAGWHLPADQPILGDHVLGYLMRNTKDADVIAKRDRAHSAFSSSASVQVAAVETSNAHRSGKSATAPNSWGKSVALGEYLMGVYSKMQLGSLTTSEQQDYIDALSLSVDYILGGNPMGMTWVTGLGSRSPQNPLHHDSLIFQTRDGLPPIPGIVVYGPITGVPGATYYDYGKNAIYPDFGSRPSIRRYADIRSFVATNEFTIGETQSNVTSLVATLLGTGLEVPGEWQPGQSNHKDRLPLGEHHPTIAKSNIYLGSAPSRPDLIDSSDSGDSNTDNVTTINNPTFSGKVSAGSKVNLYSSIDGQVGSVVATGQDYLVTSSKLSHGVHQITAVASDSFGNQSAASAALKVTILWPDYDGDGIPDELDSDDDNDGVDDSQEKVDGTDSKDAGSVVSRLSLTTYSNWNSFLDLWNVAEYVNLKDDSLLSVKSQMFTNSGQAVADSKLSFNVLPGAEVDLLVHDLGGFEKDSYGILKSVIDGEVGDYDGRMVHYRVVNDQIEFAFAMPYTNGLVGSQFVAFNTYQPSLDPADSLNPVANWIAVTNLSQTAQNGKLIFYSQDGSILSQKEIQLQAMTRKDIAGHEFGANRVGLVQWRPERGDAAFQLQNVRYLYDNPELSNSFTSAFQLDGAKGTGQPQLLPVDTRDGTSVVELSNVKDEATFYSLDIYRNDGGFAHRTTGILDPYASIHIVVDQLLPGALGSVVVKTSPQGRIIATTMQYGRNESNGIRYLYGMLAQQPLGSVLKGSYNTFLEQDCSLLIINKRNSAQTVSIGMIRYDQTTVLLPKTVTIPGNGIHEDQLCDNDTSDNLGVVTVMPEFNNSISSYVVRVGKNNRYRFPTPVR